MKLTIKHKKLHFLCSVLTIQSDRKIKKVSIYESFILALCVVDLKQKNVYGFLCKKRIIKIFL